MDKFIIFGAFEFIGFHFCERLLEKGCCVTGLHYPMNSGNDVEEKRLRVARNSNFKELTLHQADTFIHQDEDPAIIIFPLYDLYMTNNVAILTDKTVSGPVLKFLNDRKEREEKIVYLLPLQLLSDASSLKEVTGLRDFIMLTKHIMKNKQTFYLPTIFGPWQPKEFLFQRKLANVSVTENIAFKVKEWVHDAIFIDDAIELIIEKMEEKREGSYLLESGIPDSWNHCAEILKLDKNDYRVDENVNLLIDEQTVKLPLRTVTPFQKSLSIQKEHILQMQRLKE